MAQGIVGARIRARRQQMGLTQAELARRIGISHSYLNLIERNKRGIGGKLLNSVAEQLGITREDLDGAAERRLFDQLVEISTDPRHGALGLNAGEAGEIVGRFPAWAQAMAGLARSERSLTAQTRALNDRLTHDPFLAEAVHRMLTHTAALRAAGEILRDIDDLTDEDRIRFTRIVAGESAELSEVGTALAGYFDRAHEEGGAVGHDDEVDRLFEGRANHFAEIEHAVGSAQSPAGGPTVGLADGPRDGPRDGSAPGSTAIEGLLTQTLSSVDARDIARQRLARYAADAAAAPLGPLIEAAEAERYDAELIAARLGVAIDVVFRRLSTLPAAPGRPRFGYLETNAAGVATEIRTIPGLVPPRHGAACPLWINHIASARPGQTLRQIAVFPTGLRLMLVARTRIEQPAGFGRVAPPVTDMIAFDAQAAGATVYGRGAAPDAVPVGQSCRICPRDTCDHRVTIPVGG
ncbi:MAG: short-chain fatty acyl-CoA regulator family protein [Pseudomonadota bacterium]